MGNKKKSAHNSIPILKHFGGCVIVLFMQKQGLKSTGLYGK